MKKIRIAFLGTENSHVYCFCRVMCGNPAYEDIEIVGAYGPDEEANKQLLDAGYISYFAKTPDEFLGKVDAVVVTARHGDLHYEYAMPYLKAGVHAFIDKPFTVDLAKAEEMFRVAEQTGAHMCGGSSVRFLEEIRPLKRFVEKNKVVCGHVAAPVDMVNEYGGFYFYSSHLAEMTLRIFGYDPIEVTAQVCNNHVTVLTRYENYIVTNQFVDGCYKYHGLLINQNGIYERNIDISLIFKHECEEFATMLRTGGMKYSYEQLVAPVYYLNAVYESYMTGKTVKVKKVEL